MRLKVKIAVAAAAVTLLFGMSVAPALAATPSLPQQVALQIGDAAGNGYFGYYGQEIDLQPTSMTSIELPKDVFTFQAYVKDSDGLMKWLPFRDFESITLEDTNTVDPFGYRLGIDDTVSLTDGTAITPAFPYLIRAEYLPGGLETAVAGTTTPTPSYSETESVNVFKRGSEKLAFAKSGAVKRAGTTFVFQVSANAGVGTIKVTISKSGSKTLTYNVATDANGAATATLKLGTKRGTYKVSARFLGNGFGAASKTVV